MKKIVIVGAGFSGLSLAHELVKQGFHVEVYDKNSQVGGMISSPKNSCGFYETAANGFLNTADLEKFFNETQISVLNSSQKSSKRFIYASVPKRWPLNFWQSLVLFYKLIKFFLTKTKSQRMPGDHESMQSWVERHFGEVCANYIVAPALQGIYAADLRLLSATLIVNSFNHRPKKKKPGSIVSSAGGMGKIMQDLQNVLVTNGVKFHLNEAWHPQIQADHLVIATSVCAAPAILSQMGQTKNAQLLESVEALPLVSVTAFFSQIPKNYQGFGILFPRTEGIRALGVLMNTFIFDRPSEKNYSETWILGGALDKAILQLNDNQLLKLIAADREIVFAEKQIPLRTEITRWPQALPHYTVTWQQTLRQLVPMSSVSLHGNYLGQLGLSRILIESQKMAAELKQKLGAS